MKKHEQTTIINKQILIIKVLNWAKIYNARNKWEAEKKLSQQTVLVLKEDQANDPGFKEWLLNNNRYRYLFCNRESEPNIGGPPNPLQMRRRNEYMNPNDDVHYNDNDNDEDVEIKSESNTNTNESNTNTNSSNKNRKDRDYESMLSPDQFVKPFSKERQGDDNRNPNSLQTRQDYHQHLQADLQNTRIPSMTPQEQDEIVTALSVFDNNFSTVENAEAHFGDTMDENDNNNDNNDNNDNNNSNNTSNRPLRKKIMRRSRTRKSRAKKTNREENEQRLLSEERSNKRYRRNDKVTRGPKDCGYLFADCNSGPLIMVATKSELTDKSNS